jgi:cytochrome P450
VKYVPAWFPGASFQRFAQQNHITQREAIDRPIAVVKSGMVRRLSTLTWVESNLVCKADGTAPPSMARTMLEDDAARPSAQSQLDIIKDVAGVIYVSGADTTGSALLSFFLAMLVYPEVQAKAQAEVDRVVGPGRLPDFSDQKDMPYVQAVVNECLRWIPVVPTGESLLRMWCLS